MLGGNSGSGECVYLQKPTFYLPDFQLKHPTVPHCIPSISYTGSRRGSHHTDTHSWISMWHCLSPPPDVLSACGHHGAPQCRLSSPLQRDSAHQLSCITLSIIIELIVMLQLPMFITEIKRNPPNLVKHFPNITNVDFWFVLTSAAEVCSPHSWAGWLF